LLAALVAPGLCGHAPELQLQSDSYPNRPVRPVVPYSAGSQVDVAGRLIAKDLADAIGQGVVIDNKPGASTIISAEFVAKSPADELPAIEVSGFEVTIWSGIVGPANLPAGVVHMRRCWCINEADMRTRLSEVGLEPFPSSSPADFANYVESEIGMWRRLQAGAGILAQ
jgi:tripartite-type tricarboxylate transporter receptor subunit TctC